MKISVIIPSFNQGNYLEATLQSVIDAGGESEILLIDGGSTDDTPEIIDRWAPRLAYAVSEPDAGQADAINKGLAQAEGDVWCYLNSDDLLEPQSLDLVTNQFNQHKLDWLSGACVNFDSSGTCGTITPSGATRDRDYLTPWDRPAQHVFPFSGACFLSKEVYETIGAFDPTYHYSMDMEYYTRAYFQGGFRQRIIPNTLARWRWHEDSKTMRRGIAYGFREDEVRIAKNYLSYLCSEDRHDVTKSTQQESRALFARRSMHALQESKPGIALKELVQGALSYPSSLLWRPWWGAFRRVSAQALT